MSFDTEAARRAVKFRFPRDSIEDRLNEASDEIDRLRAIDDGKNQILAAGQDALHEALRVVNELQPEVERLRNLVEWADTLIATADYEPDGWHEGAKAWRDQANARGGQ